MPTLVVLMGLRRLVEVVDRLLVHGADPQTPAAVISRGTLPDQRVVVGGLWEIARKVAEAGLPPPATLVVGRVVCLSPHWAERVEASYAWIPPGESMR